MTNILKVIVGSQAHGLATPESDFDYRGVFVVPTMNILALNEEKPKNTNWIEGDVDNTEWELGHFLHLATKCNPTILETLLAPIDVSSPDGDDLRALFPHIWNSVGVKNAFIGYGLNQRKKFLDGKDGRPDKFAAAYCRSLYNGLELLTTGTFTVRIADLSIGQTIRRFKTGDYEAGEVIDVCLKLEKQVIAAYEANPDKKTNYAAVNLYLLDMRKKYWA